MTLTMGSTCQKRPCKTTQRLRLGLRYSLHRVVLRISQQGENGWNYERCQRNACRTFFQRPVLLALPAAIDSWTSAFPADLQFQCSFRPQASTCLQSRRKFMFVKNRNVRVPTQLRAYKGEDEAWTQFSAGALRQERSLSSSGASSASLGSHRCSEASRGHRGASVKVRPAVARRRRRRR